MISEVPLKRGPIYHNITLSNVITAAEHESDLKRESYGVSDVKILEKIDRIITAPH